MHTPSKPTPKRAYLALAAFLALSVFMYASIMYKIVNYGP